jgi:hypothetical protein
MAKAVVIVPAAPVVGDRCGKSKATERLRLANWMFVNHNNQPQNFVMGAYTETSNQLFWCCMYMLHSTVSYGNSHLRQSLDVICRNNSIKRPHVRHVRARSAPWENCKSSNPPLDEILRTIRDPSCRRLDKQHPQRPPLQIFN